MAAIISRITREQRERKVRLQREIPIYKSNYILPEFGDRYNPKEANKYMKRRIIVAKKEKIKSQLAEVVKEQLANQENVKYSHGTLICELLIIITSLSLVPILAALVTYIWPDFVVK